MEFSEMATSSQPGPWNDLAYGAASSFDQSKPFKSITFNLSPKITTEPNLTLIQAL